MYSICFFFNDTATTEIYTLSLHDALPISCDGSELRCGSAVCDHAGAQRDRKSTRLNSSHVSISYAVFCLKKKKTQIRAITAKAKETMSKVNAERLSEL